MPHGGNSKDSVFTGSIPKLYDSHMVPLVFESYARDIVGRLGGRDLSRVLEVAAGTGVVTRVLADVLPEAVAIVATDLNQEMLDEGANVGTSRVPASLNACSASPARPGATTTPTPWACCT